MLSLDIDETVNVTAAAAAARVARYADDAA